MNILSPFCSFFSSLQQSLLLLLFFCLFLCLSNCSSDSGPAHLTEALSSCKHNGTEHNATAMSFLKTVRAERHEVTGLVFVNTLKIFSV